MKPEFKWPLPGHKGRIDYRRAVSPDVVDLMVRRDPCFRCGTRADIGCKHVGLA